MNALKWTGLFFAAFGLLFGGIGGWMLWSEHSFSETSVTAEGTIVELASHRDSDGDTMYSPVAEFYDAGGQRYEFSSNTSSSSPGFSVGEKVEILYDPARPQDARIDTFGQRFFLPTMFAAMGSLFAVIGGGMVIVPIIRRRSIAELKETGIRIEGTVLTMAKDRRMSVNGENPWRVTAEAQNPRTGIMQEYKSDALWEQPVTAAKGATVPIYVSARNGKASFVDVANAKASGRPDEDGHWKFGQTRRPFGKAPPRSDED